MSQLKPPVGPRDHIKGNPKAPLTLLEYGDFECPYCGQAYPVIKRIEEEMEDNMRFVFRHFPLTQVHPHAFQAACAAEAAGLQGKFWEMHDELFEHQYALEDEDLTEYAQAVGLNAAKFLKDLISLPVSKKVREDFLSGVRSGVNGTPTFFINGQRYIGPHEYKELFLALQMELLKNEGKKAYE